MNEAGTAKLSTDDMRSAVQAGILTEAQAATLIAHAQARMGYRSAMLADDEPFEFFKGFAEIFVTIGLGLLTGGVVGLTVLFVSWAWGAGLGFFICLMLARYYTLERRMSLPSIALAVGTAISSTAFFGSFLVTEQTQDETPFLIISAIGMVTMLGYFHLFKLPFAMFVFGLFCMAFVYGVAIDGGEWFYLASNFPAALFDLGQGANVALASLGFGFAMMTAGLWFDMKDPHRISRHAVTGFWLHILAAPALVNTCAMSLYNLGDTRGYVLTALLMCFVTLFAIVIDRRSFLTAGLFYFAAVIIWAATASFGDQIGGFMVVAIIGGFFTTIGTWWVQIRAAVMRTLPDFPGKSRLPPYVLEV
jgi:hypothetical protein|tara:strand:- start:411 stop:1496 length:1086 start_codon:yes stop_codon:yes gene_type:complete